MFAKGKQFQYFLSRTDRDDALSRVAFRGIYVSDIFTICSNKLEFLRFDTFLLSSTIDY